MTNSAPITLAQLWRYKAPPGTEAAARQDAAIAELEPDIQQNGYAAAMRRDRPWFATWSQGGKQPDPVSAAPWLPPARAIVQKFEGCRLTAYPDPETGGDPWTIGWGTTAINGQPVRPGQTCTQAEADAWLDARLRGFHADVLRLLPMASNWSPNRQAALVSFVYNVGAGALADSTLRRRLLAGEDPAAVVRQELPKWINAGGPTEAGLRRRRAAEIELFTGGGRPAPVATRQEWLTRIKALNLSQPDPQTCQATCIAMAVRDANIGGIRQKLTAIGSAGDPAVMRQVIRGYGVRYQYEGNACLQDVYGWLKAGEFLITHGWFTRSGHVICLDGLKVDGGATLLNVKDPWSEFNASAWAYNLGGSFYDGFYSDRLIYAACVAGVGAADAQRIYQAGTVDPLRRGMWVHRFLV
jgi:GH24 family phage-related lysozyme (muramidase)